MERRSKDRSLRQLLQGLRSLIGAVLLCSFRRFGWLDRRFADSSTSAFFDRLGRRIDQLRQCIRLALECPGEYITVLRHVDPGFFHLLFSQGRNGFCNTSARYSASSSILS